MSSKQATVDYIIDQLAGAGDIRARKMFGEYALYYDGKVVALVCDDRLFVKITEPGREFAGDLYAEGFPYEGAKPYMIIHDELIDDREWLSGLVVITAEALSDPKTKHSRKR